MMGPHVKPQVARSRSGSLISKNSFEDSVELQEHLTKKCITALFDDGLSTISGPHIQFEAALAARLGIPPTRSPIWRRLAFSFSIRNGQHDSSIAKEVDKEF
jgi:hypothetical protein